VPIKKSLYKTHQLYSNVLIVVQIFTWTKQISIKNCIEYRVNYWDK